MGQLDLLSIQAIKTYVQHGVLQRYSMIQKPGKSMEEAAHGNFMGEKHLSEEIDPLLTEVGPVLTITGPDD